MHLQTSIRCRHHLWELRAFITFDKFCSDVPEAASALHTFYTIVASFETLVIARNPSDPELGQVVSIQD